MSVTTRARFDAAAVARGAAAAAAIGAFVSPPLASLALLVMLLAFLAASPAARMRAVWQQPLARAAVVLLAVAALAVSWSAAPWPARLNALWGWRSFGFLVLCLALFETPQQRARFALAFVIATAVGSVVSYAGYFAGQSLYKELAPGIVFRNHVTQGVAFAVGAFLAATLALTSHRTPPWRFGLGVVVLLLVANVLFVSFGRSGHLTLLLVFGTAGVLLLRGRQRAAMVAAVPALAALMFFVSPLIQQKFALGWQEMRNVQTDPHYTSMGHRIVNWRTTLAMIEARPLLGYGIGGFAPEYKQRVEREQTDWRRSLVDDPHNQYLFVQVEMGVLGLAAFFWFLLSALRQAAPPPWRVVGWSILAAWCVTSLVSSHFSTFNEGHLIALLLGAFLGDGRAPQPATSAASTAASTSS